MTVTRPAAASVDLLIVIDHDPIPRDGPTSARGLVRPDLAGLVKVRFVISGTGNVTSATAWESTFDDAEVESCVENALLGFRFPEPRGGGVVIVRYPFELRPVW